MIQSKRTRQAPGRLLAAVALLFLSTLACALGEPEPLYTPETPTQYTAEDVTVHEVYILIDDAGNMVDFGGPYSYGADAILRYVLRFWDVGSRVEGHEAAAIFKVYSPQRITGFSPDLEAGLSEEQKADARARTAFPSTEVQYAELTFSGGPEGTFTGTNLDTGNEIYGYMDWRQQPWEMHVCFYHDIMQRACTMDFLVQGEEPFYNWP